MKNSFFNVLPLLIIITSCGGGGSSDIDQPITINPSIISFTVSSSNAEVGSSVTLTWSSSNAISCSGGLEPYLHSSNRRCIDSQEKPLAYGLDLVDQ